MVPLRSKLMINLVEQVKSAGISGIPLLITGETGTGKTHLAQVYHAAAGSDIHFVPIVCPTLNSTLAESELFGSVRGAYTGAEQDREGLVAKADGGTLFLDEIGDLLPSIQAKLLGLLDNGAYRRIGDTKELRVKFRVVSATNRDITTLVTSGEFRTDLLHRLRGIHVHIPPLRDRPEDIPDLVAHFINQESATIGRGAPTINASAIQLLANQKWPGNIRQLRMTIISAFRSSVGIRDLTPAVIAPYIADDQYFQPVNQQLVSVEGPMLDALQEFGHVMGYNRQEALSAFPEFWRRHGSFLQATMLVAWQKAVAEAAEQQQRASNLSIISQVSRSKKTMAQQAREEGISRSTLYRRRRQSTLIT
jgi:DNA-binding NtrC family response regulator